MRVDEIPTSEYRHFVDRALNDTGFMCRHLLGYNYDKDDEGNIVNVGSGGIRPDGNHKKMSEFLDDESSVESRSKHMESPRGSLKTTLIQGYLTRKAVKNRNIRILYGMHTYTKALEKLSEIKEQFEGKYNDGLLVEVFGEHDEKLKKKTLMGKPWSVDGFTIKGRTIPNAEPTFTGFGVDKMVTGGHYDIIVFDDMVHEKNVNTKEGIELVLRVYRMVGPLLENGGILIVNGTRYADGDLYAYILEEQFEDFKHLVIDVGVDAVKDQNGVFQIVGKSTFPHISNKRLARELKRMGYRFFCAQYLNKIVVGTETPFRREQFQTCRYEHWMRDLSIYFLTDTATSDKEEGCYSTIIVVGMDSADNAYVLDTALGHMEVETFKRAFFNLYLKWANKGWFRGASFEQGSLGTVFRSVLDERARQMGIKLNYVEQKRGVGEPTKNQRIRGLQPRFNEGRIWFCTDTMPKKFTDLSLVKTLFDPEGYVSESGVRLPDGELVLELIRHPRYPKNDWADALADIEGIDKKSGRRLITFVPPTARERSRRVKRRGQTVKPLTDYYAEKDTPGRDWYGDAAGRLGA